MKPSIVQQMINQCIMNQSVHKDEAHAKCIGMYQSIVTSG